jgi:signal transduction histidine kinase
VVGSILGPVLGAGVAIVVVRGFAAVARESAGRQRLIDELEGAREHLAAAERAEAVAVERERLAREIHDTLAQGFSSIELLLRAAGDFIGRGDEPAARDLIDRSRDEARRNLEEARRFVRGLAPADLVSGTLVRALERAATRAGGSGGPQVRVVTSGTAGDVPVVVEAALLRVAQSALANALQHADAANVAITVTFLDGGGDAAVALDIVDDGIGFDPDAVASRAGGRRLGFGLVAMRSRVEELGGELAVESTPGLGTAISANVPITLGVDAEPELTPVPVSIDEVRP